MQLAVAEASAPALVVVAKTADSPGDATRKGPAYNDTSPPPTEYANVTFASTDAREIRTGPTKCPPHTGENMGAASCTAQDFAAGAASPGPAKYDAPPSKLYEKASAPAATSGRATYRHQPFPIVAVHTVGSLAAHETKGGSS